MSLLEATVCRSIENYCAVRLRKPISYLAGWTVAALLTAILRWVAASSYRSRTLYVLLVEDLYASASCPPTTTALSGAGQCEGYSLGTNCC